MSFKSCNTTFSILVINWFVLWIFYEHSNLFIFYRQSFNCLFSPIFFFNLNSHSIYIWYVHCTVLNLNLTVTIFSGSLFKTVFLTDILFKPGSIIWYGQYFIQTVQSFYSIFSMGSPFKWYFIRNLQFLYLIWTYSPLNWWVWLSRIHQSKGESV